MPNLGKEIDRGPAALLQLGGLEDSIMFSPVGLFRWHRGHWGSEAGREACEFLFGQFVAR